MVENIEKALLAFDQLFFEQASGIVFFQRA